MIRTTSHGEHQNSGYVLRAADLEPAELPELLAAWPITDGRSAWIWLEAADGFTLDAWSGCAGKLFWYQAGKLPEKLPVAEVLPRILSGRLFSPDGELRWRFLPILGNRSIRAVVLGKTELAERFGRLSPRSELDSLSRSTMEYQLWGQQTPDTPGEWIELRIPHRFRYPVEAGVPVSGRVLVKLEVELWRDRAGRVQFVRLCRVFATQEP
jgi:hypothetical protein